MNSLKQYLDLYRRHEAALCGNAAPAMNAARRRAASHLATAQLPRRGDENYAVTDLDAMFSPDYGINLSRMPFRADAASVFRCDVPNISASPIVTANDVYCGMDGAGRLPEGVTVCSFAEAPLRAPGVMESLYGRVADDSRAAVALNTLLAQDGVLIHVAKGVKADKPVQLLNVLGGVTAPILAVRRLLVAVEADARVQIVGCDLAADSMANASSMVAEIFVAENAQCDLAHLEESSGETRRYASFDARLMQGATLNFSLLTLRCGTTRNEVNVHLDGRDARCNVNGMAVTDGTQTADNSVNVFHRQPYGTSHQLFKYVADDESRVGFEGLIDVAAGAHHTAAEQNNRNLLASPQARVHTQPQLLIYCDDVKCGHGAATGQLDAEALFYMRSRGIPEATARVMLMQAFMADVIAGVSPEPLRQRLQMLVDRRLSGASGCSDCADCHTAKPSADL